MGIFFDVAKIMSQTDRKGNKNIIHFVEGNRAVGKTFSIVKYVTNYYLKNKKQFIWLYRYQTELSNVAEKIYKDVTTTVDRETGKINFEEYEFYSISCSQGQYHKIFIRKKDSEEKESVIGYAIAINSAEKIKKQRAEFKFVDTIIFDEYVSEFNNYCPDEVNKFLSIITTVSSGDGKAYRPINVLMAGNSTDKYNPYYEALKLPEVIFNDSTKTYKGIGFVINFYYNEAIANEVQRNPILNAFNTQYLNYATGFKTYLNNNNALVCHKDISKANYVFNLLYKNEIYAVFAFGESLHITQNSVDFCKNTYCFYVDDLNLSTKLLTITAKNNLKQALHNGLLTVETGKIMKIINALK